MKFVLMRLGTESAPQVALFSLEGPNPIGPGVLKPDILAPRFEGLAAISLSYHTCKVVTNGGNDDNTVYQAHLENVPFGMKIKVVPKTLTFTRKYHKQGFVVSIEIDREFQMNKRQL
ncbi:subtilisin-like protease sbt1.5 [Quercus suber]|uniref:Subtilisin-like protease sbt1.5 n=1 Tax=Quercus suber TaxID=58331 RepID=A0AAW0IMK9_QUESU